MGFSTATQWWIDWWRNGYHTASRCEVYLFKPFQIYQTIRVANRFSIYVFGARDRRTKSFTTWKSFACHLSIISINFHFILLCIGRKSDHVNGIGCECRSTIVDLVSGGRNRRNISLAKGDFLDRHSDGFDVQWHTDRLYFEKTSSETRMHGAGNGRSAGDTKNR